MVKKDINQVKQITSYH